MGALWLWEARSAQGYFGGKLTVIYSSECLAPTPRTAKPAPMLPLLVILFIISYAILTLLVFEQGKTIESQRSLIREMLKDSTQLAALKDRLARDDSKRIQDKASMPAVGKGVESRNSAAGANGSAAGSTTGSDKKSKRAGKSAHATKEIPQRPAADLEDVRRSTRVI